MIEPVKTTARGFDYRSFTDRNGIECSIQQSSLATEEAIWFGANEMGLKRFQAGKGWQDVTFPNTIADHTVGNNRMHLTREQVAELLPVLQKFVDTGELE